MSLDIDKRPLMHGRPSSPLMIPATPSRNLLRTHLPGLDSVSRRVEVATVCQLLPSLEERFDITHVAQEPLSTALALSPPLMSETRRAPSPACYSLLHTPRVCVGHR